MVTNFKNKIHAKLTLIFKLVGVKLLLESVDLKNFKFLIYFEVLYVSIYESNTTTLGPNDEIKR